MKKLTILVLILFSTAFLYAVENPPVLIWAQKSEFNVVELVTQSAIFRIDTSLNMIWHLNNKLTDNMTYTIWFLSAMNAKTGELIDDERIDFPYWVGHLNHYQSNDTFYFHCTKQPVNTQSMVMSLYIPTFSLVKLRLSAEGFDPIPAYSDGYMADTSNKGSLTIYNVRSKFNYIRETNDWIIEMPDTSKDFTTFVRANMEGATTTSDKGKLDTIAQEYYLSNIPDWDEENVINKRLGYNSYNTLEIDDTLTINAIQIAKKQDTAVNLHQPILSSGKLLEYYNRHTGEFYSKKFIPETRRVSGQGTSYINGKIYNFYAEVMPSSLSLRRVYIIDEMNLEGEILRSYNIPYYKSNFSNQTNSTMTLYLPADSNYVYMYGYIDEMYDGTSNYRSYISKYKVGNNTLGELVWEFEFQYEDSISLRIYGMSVHGNDIYLNGEAFYPKRIGDDLEPEYHVWLKYSETTGIEEQATIPHLQIVPNPAKDLITVNFANRNINSLEIIDNNGKVCFETSINATDIEAKVDISELSAGIYFVKIIDNNNNVHSKQFIKE